MRFSKPLAQLFLASPRLTLQDHDFDRADHIRIWISQFEDATIASLNPTQAPTAAPKPGSTVIITAAPTRTPTNAPTAAPTKRPLTTAELLAGAESQYEAAVKARDYVRVAQLAQTMGQLQAQLEREAKQGKAGYASSGG